MPGNHTVSKGHGIQAGNSRFYSDASRQPTKVGFLFKHSGSVVKTWQKRWYALYANSLCYFSSPESTKPQGVFELKGHNVSESKSADTDRCLFEIFPTAALSKIEPSQASSLVLDAITEQERTEWVTALKRAMFSSVGGAIFGQPLEDTLYHESKLTGLRRKIPQLVESCVEYLMERGVTIEGIFRLPGRKTVVTDLKERYDRGERPNLSEVPPSDVHAVGSLLKQYLYSLPESLIPFTHYEDVMKVFNRQVHKLNPDSAAEILCEVFKKIPPANYNLLQYLCKFLHEVSQHCDENKMSEINIATVFSQSFIRPEIDDIALLMGTADNRIQATFFLLNQHVVIFRTEFSANGSILDVGQLLDIEFDEPVYKSFQANEGVLFENRASVEDALSNPPDVFDQLASDVADEGLPSPLNPEEVLNAEGGHNARGSRTGRVFHSFDNNWEGEHEGDHEEEECDKHTSTNQNQAGVVTRDDIQGNTATSREALSMISDTSYTTADSDNYCLQQAASDNGDISEEDRAIYMSVDNIAAEAARDDDDDYVSMPEYYAKPLDLNSDDGSDSGDYTEVRRSVLRNKNIHTDSPLKPKPKPRVRKSLSQALKEDSDENMNIHSKETADVKTPTPVPRRSVDRATCGSTSEVKSLLQADIDAMSHEELTEFTRSILAKLQVVVKENTELKEQLEHDQLNMKKSKEDEEKVRHSLANREDAVKDAVTKVVELQSKLSHYQSTYG